MIQERRILYSSPNAHEAQLPLCVDLTTVPLPGELHLSDRESVVDLLGQLVQEEAATNNNYFGAILFGSVSRGVADRNSDIDLIHIAQTEDSQHTFPLRLRLEAIFLGLYDVHIDQGWTPIGLQEVRQRAQTGANTLSSPSSNVHCLDRDSIILVPDEAVRQEVEKLLPFRFKAPVFLPKVGFRLDLPACLNINMLEHPEQLPHWETIKFLQHQV